MDHSAKIENLFEKSNHLSEWCDSRDNLFNNLFKVGFNILNSMVKLIMIEI